MRYSIVFQENIYNDLVAHLFSNQSHEQAAYALCKMSVNEYEIKLIVRDIIPVLQDDIEEQSSVHMKIRSRSFMSAMKEADINNCTFVFIHSHPKDFKYHSTQDDIEERELFRLAYTRIKTQGLHASIVFSSAFTPIARIWDKEGNCLKVNVIKIVGERFRFLWNDDNNNLNSPIFDRQIRAFGSDIQKLISQLHIAIVGLGGTGSAIYTQLTRLGIGKLTICDGQRFEISNINRVYGSSASDENCHKTDIAYKAIAEIGLNTEVISLYKPCTYLDVTNAIKNCDLVFGCTDDDWGRSILTKLAVYYHTPVIDLGVSIDSVDGIVNSIDGRVTTLLGNYACLFCRERITGKRIEAQVLHETDPQKYEARKKEGYIPELDDPAPAVIPFTTQIASWAITEMLNRLIGFMGSDRISNETLIRIDKSEIRTNRRESKPGCFCGLKDNQGLGDVNPLLDLTWR